MTSYVSIFNTALAQTAKELTEQVRALTSRAGWPANVCSALRVEYRNGSFAVTFPPEAAPVIDTLENGTQDQGPSAVLRRFETSVARKGGDVLMGILTADLRKAKALA